MDRETETESESDTENRQTGREVRLISSGILSAAITLSFYFPDPRVYCDISDSLLCSRLQEVLRAQRASREPTRVLKVS